MLKENEFVHIDFYSCESIEDDFNKGEIGGNCAYWDISNCPIKENRFKSVKGALKAICDANCFEFDEHNWTDFFDESGEETDRGRFDGDVTVDVDNSEADDAQKEKWKKGELKLYNCHIVCQLSVRAERKLADDELCI